METGNIVAARSNSSWHRSVLEVLLTSSSEAILVWNAAGEEVLANAAARSLNLDAIHRLLVKGENSPYDLMDGGDRAFAPDDWPVWKAFRDGRRIEGQAIFLHRPGGEVRELWVNAAPVFDDRGRSQGAVGLFTDVTEKNQAYHAMVQNEKLALTGKLAAVLTHEINNPLQASIGCLGLAEEVLAENGDVSQYLAVAADELKRAAQILNQLRNLNRPASTASRELVDLRSVLETAITLNRGRFEDLKVDVEVDEEGDLPMISAVPGRIRQVFLNLVLNALDAMADGGRLSIRLQSTREPAGVQVRIQDTGEGISAEEIEQIFEPFYTTRPGGLGLGLFVTRAIIIEHGGSIQLESHSGAGTVFSVWLPASQAS